MGEVGCRLLERKFFLPLEIFTISTQFWISLITHLTQGEWPACPALRMGVTPNGGFAAAGLLIYKLYLIFLIS